MCSSASRGQSCTAGRTSPSSGSSCPARQTGARRSRSRHTPSACRASSRRSTSPSSRGQEVERPERGAGRATGRLLGVRRGPEQGHGARRRLPHSRTPVLLHSPHYCTPGSRPLVLLPLARVHICWNKGRFHLFFLGVISFHPCALTLQWPSHEMSPLPLTHLAHLQTHTPHPLGGRILTLYTRYTTPLHRTLAQDMPHHAPARSRTPSCLRRPEAEQVACTARLLERALKSIITY